MKGKILKNKTTALLLTVFFFALLLTVPALDKIPNHPDEHQFYFNAFRIMEGRELHNYLHIATTEYALAGFFYIVNIVTDTGVNFPQGDPTDVTFYYGKVFGFFLYFLSAILGCIIIQKNERKIKIRTVLFSFLFFTSLAMFERFVRVNSDSMGMFVFLNFFILSMWQHKNKAPLIEFFFLNTLFLFLISFTNLKFLYLTLPLFALNTLVPLFFRDRDKTKDVFSLTVVYKLILYGIGMVSIVIGLWKVLIPKEFSQVKFWYTLKKTIIHGTQFDFDYPSQAGKSWLAYLYDLLAFQINFYVLFALFAFLLLAYYVLRKELVKKLGTSIKGQLKTSYLKGGNLYAQTEIILFASFIMYYIGISTREIHWSRWGMPLGFVSFLLISSALERVWNLLFKDGYKKNKALLYVFPYLLLIAVLPRVFLFLDLRSSDFINDGHFSLTQLDQKKFMHDKNVTSDDLAWFTGYTPNIDSISFEEVATGEYSNKKYLLWPAWNIGTVYTSKAADTETHNQRKFIENYTSDVEYRFPTKLSRYMHKTKKFAWNVLGVTWTPEIDSLVEPHYAVLKLRNLENGINLDYKLKKFSVSRYKSTGSMLFNSKNLDDTYTLPPCHTYAAVREVNTGEWVLEPPEGMGKFGKTAGLTCHSIRFRVFPRGVYFVKISGLPKEGDISQKLYYNLGSFDWDPQQQIARFVVPNTVITAEFGVALEQSRVPDLQFEVSYTFNDDINNQIEEALQNATAQEPSLDN